MSPVVVTLPLIVKSEDKTEGVGLVFGALDVLEEDVDADVALDDFDLSFESVEDDALGVSSDLFLVNISSCLYVCHWVDGSTARVNLVVKMAPRAPPCVPHITY